MMRGWLAVVLGVLLSVSLIHAQDAQTDPLNEVKRLYNQGLLDEAELVALRYVNRTGELQPVDRAELHRYLAYISIARDDRLAGKQQFIAALQLNPRLRMDPTLTSPKILGVFNQAKQEFEAMGRQRFRSSDAEARSYRLRVEGGIRSLMLPGLGQLHKGHTGRGWTLISLTGLTAVGFGYSQTEVLRLKDDYETGTDPVALPGIYQDYRDAWKIRNSFGLALGVLWTVGVLDAFIWPPPAPGPDLEPTIIETPVGFTPGFSLRIRF